VSNTQIVVLIVGVSLIMLLGGLTIFVMARMRRIIKSQFDTIEKLISVVRANQGHDKPTKPS
jgi:hypothetical protein